MQAGCLSLMGIKFEQKNNVHWKKQVVHLYTENAESKKPVCYYCPSHLWALVACCNGPRVSDRFFWRGCVTYPGPQSEVSLGYCNVFSSNASPKNVLYHWTPCTGGQEHSGDLVWYSTGFLPAFWLPSCKAQGDNCKYVEQLNWAIQTPKERKV